MEQMESSKILYSKEVETLVKGIHSSKANVESVSIESLDDLLDIEAPLFPYHFTFDEAVRHPIVVLHSSGSTGLPKPVVMTHGTFAVIDNDRNFPTVPGRKNHDLTIWDFDGTPGRIYAPFPPFHLAGFQNKVMVPLFTYAIPVYGPPLRPPSGALVAHIIEQQRVRGCLLPPSVAEQLLHEPNGLECVKSLDIFCYAGGPLSPATGDAISEVTSLCQFYGSTEVGQIRQLVPRREDWSHMEFHPNAKIEFRPADDAAFELVVFADTTTEESVSLNHNYPGVREWYTKDLFRRHPTKENLWRFHGRKDDILVLSNGEKLNPIPIESQLQGLPKVSGALVIGQSRVQPALLLEMETQVQEDKNALLDEIWPAVESANLLVPGYGRIVRSMILFSNLDKPFVRAGKGTIVRKLTERAYADEIEDLYTGKNSQPISRIVPLVADAFSIDTINNLIRSILSPTMNPDKLKGNEDLFNSGLDSLKTIEAVQTLMSSLVHHRKRSDLSWLSAETFYNNPSIDKLSELLSTFLNHGTTPRAKDRIAEMSSLLEHFAGSFTYKEVHPVINHHYDSLSVILTGTTGSLGRHILNMLSCDSHISEIHCLNRSSTAEEQWHDHCAGSDSGRSLGNVKVTFITVDYGLENFGLTEPDYYDIIKKCDLIVHAAWKIDFNQSLFSFRDNIRSVQTFANWSDLGQRRPRIVFVSSISSVGPWNKTYDDDSGIPEMPIENLAAALKIGYGESKQVAERLLDRAATRWQIPVSILRIGQIVGARAAEQAPWPQRELMPSMLRTSKSISLVPSDLPPIDWIPVDTVSKVVIEIALKDVRDWSHTPKYYHVVNPQPVPWCDFVPAVKRHCGPGVQAVPISQWVEKLRTYDVTDPEVVSSKPALKMLNFFAMMASHGPTTKYQTSASVQSSETMAALEPVSQTMMHGWLNQSE